MSLKAKVEAIIYAAEEPVTLEQLASLLREAVLAELAASRAQAGEETEAAGGGGEYAAESAQLEEMNLASAPGSALSEDARDDAPDDTEAPQASSQPASEAAAAGKRSAKRTAVRSAFEIATDKAIRTRLRELLDELIADYAADGRGMEIRQIAGGYRMATKPEHHDVIRAFAKSLKPPIRLSLAALETLAVIAYKQPVTAPEISEIRGVDSGGVLGTLLDRKLITTAGRKQVIGRPIQYKTSKDFLLRFGLNEVGELPSMEEFSQLASEATIEVASEPQAAPSLFPQESAATEAPPAEPVAEAAQDPSPEGLSTKDLSTEDLSPKAPSPEDPSLEDPSPEDEKPSGD